MLIFALLLSSASAAGVYPNSTTTPTTISSSSSAPTTSVIPYVCNPDNGQNCDRLPEQPFYNYITPGVINYQFDNVPFDNPWMYDDMSLSGDAASSATSCGIYFSSLLSDYKASAPVTYLAYLPQSTVTYTYPSITEVGDTYSIVGSTTFVTTFVYGAPAYSTSATTVTEAISSLLGPYTTTEAATTMAWVHAGYTPARYVSDFTFSATSPCCYSCTLFGGDIQVFYWPTATASTNITSSTVNPAGLTM